MNDLEIKINEGFVRLVNNYETLIVFIKGEITKGYDDEFWQKLKTVAIYSVVRSAGHNIMYGRIFKRK